MSENGQPNRRDFLAGMTALAASSGAIMANAESVQNPPDGNYDESKVPAYTLPDPLVMADGTAVTSAQQWFSNRRPQLLDIFAQQVYGRTPEAIVPLRIEQVESSANVLEGRGRREQYLLHLGEGENAIQAELLVYLPTKATPESPVPAFLGFNFGGNHAVSPEPEIRLNTGWFRDQPKGSHPDNRASEQNRGTESSRWPIATALDRGYAVATMHYGDFDPDYDDGFHNGVHALLDPPGTADPNRPPDAWGSIAAWAWGLSRGLDALERITAIDATRVAVMGHSRLGKTALWAGARDGRFALVISNDSGCGGAALSRRKYGETVARINNTFPHWFCDNFTRYNDKEAELPVDQHELIALIAPRPVLVCSAEQDLWADPRGEFLACLGADPVYRLLGLDGLAADRMPGVNQPVLSTIGYHIRPGEHDVTDRDWAIYLAFADKHLAPKP